MLQEHLFQLEAEHGIADDGLPLYVIYPDEAGANWRVHAVPISPDSFKCRKALPEEWRGLRDDNLSKLTGIDDCIFVHASGFIGGKLPYSPCFSPIFNHGWKGIKRERALSTSRDLH